MTSDNRQRSLQSIIRSHQQSAFVGREEQLDRFRHNINLPVEDPERRFIFNVYGQGGVGKSTLLQQYGKIAGDSAVNLAAYTAESEQNVLDVMARIAAQFKKLERPLKTFSEHYHVYRQKRQEIETDPEAPKGLPVLLGRTIVKVGVGLGRTLPGVGAGLSFVNDDVLAEQAGDLAAFLARKLTNKDEVILVREPIETLTPLFLADLSSVAKTHTLALFFDTYEHTSEFLETWLLDLLKGTYGELSSNIVMTIAGRDQLDPNLWSEYERVLCYQHLDAFNEEELKKYLSRQSITDARVTEEIDRLTKRLPLLVATLATGRSRETITFEDQSETAIDCFLKGEKNVRLRQLALDAALTRSLNHDILAVFVNDDVAILFDWLKGKPFVVTHQDGWAYHEVVRSQMLRYKLRESPQSWAELHEHLAVYYQKLRDDLNLKEDKRWSDAAWQKYSLEALYHRLCQSPPEQLENALDGFIAALKGDWSFPLRWAEAVEQAGSDVQSKEVEQRGKEMAVVVNSYMIQDCGAAAEALTTIFDRTGSDRSGGAAAMGWRGYIYYLMGQTQKALADFDEAIRLEPTEAEYWTSRGLTFAEADYYGEALRDFNYALELNPKYEKAIISRARVYVETGRAAEALSDLDSAIELSPHDMMLLVLRLCFLWTKGDSAELGKTFTDLAMQSRRLIDQAQDIQEGLSKIPSEIMDRHLRRWGRSLGLDENAIHTMLVQMKDLLSKGPDAFMNLIKALAAEAEALMYAGNKQLDNALTACNKMIELCPSEAHFRLIRGEVHRLMNNLPGALADYNVSLELHTNDVDLLARRGHIYQAMGDNDDALADFNKALELKPEHPVLLSMRQALCEQMEIVKTTNSIDQNEP